MIGVFDIGGTHTRFGYSTDAVSFDSDPMTIKTQQNFESGLQTLQSLVGSRKCENIIVGFAGVLAKDNMSFIASPHISGWVNEPLVERISELFRAKVSLVNDAALAGMGEAAFGAGKGKSIVAYLTFGTGVGGARIVDGKIDRNTFGFEPGHHLSLSGNAPSTWESLVSGSALESIYHKIPQDIDDESVWEDVARHIAVGVANSIVYWSPETVVINGPIAKRAGIDRIKEYIKPFIAIFPELPDIQEAKLGDHAGLYGGLALAREMKSL